MKKITIINLTLLLLTQSQSYLLAPAEPAKVEPAKENSADKQQPTTAAEKNYENQTSHKTTQEPNNNAGTVATKQEPSATTSTKSETGISLESAKNTGEEEGEEETFTDVIIDHGGESDVEHAVEKIKEDSEEADLKAEETGKSKKEAGLKAQEAGKSKEKSSEHEEIKTDAADAIKNMTPEQNKELEASIKKTTQAAKNDPSKSAEISYATSKIMEVASLPTKEESGVYKI
ncbi:hypothetical protein [Candidatus Chromulinivorax destructor]|uniref:Uncharacterized protein n=1 Tax=Candidatus Chromulinivorax destructor TaxID=2066483 RepID=A0A345ZCS2_9BACT|nr:hypothetical protein [Candidatus Chromulinivorax destructor]AXK61089.1 hypothetical protein C0J27_05150 [Candidatus Chromulinivorax destructor]